jgi:uncharacterized membrane protein YdjX (TVP38/TMEM64 family)
MEWSKGNSFFISLLVILALTADVFLPVPNGLTNTLAGVALGWPIASLVVWIGLNLGAIFGYCVGRFFGRPIAKFIVGEKDLNDAEKSSKNFDVIGLILSRPVPAFAELSTLAAGITKMNFLKFICVVFTVNIGVAVIFAGLGAAALASSSSTIAFFGAAILPAIFYFTYRKIYKD